VGVGFGSCVLYSDDEFETIDARNLDPEFSLRGITSTPIDYARFIAVGDHYVIMSSPNALGWTLRTGGIGVDLNAVTWSAPPLSISSDSFAVAVGKGGAVLTSPDAIAWTRQSTPTSNELTDVVSGSVRLENPPIILRRIVAVGRNATILYSSNGTDWHTADDPQTNFHITSVCTIPGGFAAATMNGTVLTSPDGSSWTSHDVVPNLSFYDIAWDDNQLVVVGSMGEIFVSRDMGEHWTERFGPRGQDLSTILELPSGRLAVAGQNSLLATSDAAPDFADWMAAQSPPAGEAGPDADPNHDGVPNLLAYAFGIPAVAPAGPGDMASLPRAVPRAAGQALVMRLRPATPPRADLIWTVENSTSLSPGGWMREFQAVPGGMYSGRSITIVRTGNPQNDTYLVIPGWMSQHGEIFARIRVEQTH